MQITDLRRAWDQRHSMVASALIGTAWSRWILAGEPLAAAPRAQVARWLGPSLEHFATSLDFSDVDPLASSVRSPSAG